MGGEVRQLTEYEGFQPSKAFLKSGRAAEGSATGAAAWKSRVLRGSQRWPGRGGGSPRFVRAIGGGAARAAFRGPIWRERRAGLRCRGAVPPRSGRAGTVHRRTQLPVGETRTAESHRRADLTQSP